jgi:8-hydroxy-5-deazaflavin:NADPH oxidoreductase
METIAVIGAGSVGRTLATAWAAAGHQVLVGSRTPEKEQPPAGTTVTDPVSAIDGSRVVVYTIPGPAMPDVLAAHAGALAGRIVIDATNNMASGHAGELSALRHLPAGATGFRAFNSVGWENMANPVLGGVAADMFYAGPDGAERETVGGLIADVGFRPVYVGADTAAVAVVDSVAGLWFALAFGQGHGRRLAFRVLTDSGTL